MTESVTPPRAPDPPLVDPVTGETPPLSPPRGERFMANLMPLKRAIEADPGFQRWATEIDAKWAVPPWWREPEPLEPSGVEVAVPWPMKENDGR